MYITHCNVYHHTAVVFTLQFYYHLFFLSTFREDQGSVECGLEPRPGRPLPVPLSPDGLLSFRCLLLLLFSRSVLSNSLWPHGLQHARPPCPSPFPRVCLNSCPLSWWCHPTISSSVTPFSSCLHSFSASGSFLVSQLFTSGGQSIGASASASVLSMNI